MTGVQTCALPIYCRHSANPVGEIVLRLFDGWTEQRGRWSDAICTALQLANFWQDVTVDALKNRIYIPLDELAAVGLTPESVLTGPATPAHTKAIAGLVDRTWALFNEGRPLTREAPPRLRRELRMVWLGGTEILRKIESLDYDVWSKRPRVSKWDWARLFGKMLLGA